MGSNSRTPGSSERAPGSTPSEPASSSAKRVKPRSSAFPVRCSASLGSCAPPAARREKPRPAWVQGAARAAKRVFPTDAAMAAATAPPHPGLRLPDPSPCRPSKARRLPPLRQHRPSRLRRPLRSQRKRPPRPLPLECPPRRAARPHRRLRPDALVRNRRSFRAGARSEQDAEVQPQELRRLDVVRARKLACFCRLVTHARQRE